MISIRKGGIDQVLKQIRKQVNECPGAKTESEERSCNANAGVPVPHMCPPCSPVVVQGRERNKATLMLRSPNEMPDAISSVAVNHWCAVLKLAIASSVAVDHWVQCCC